MNINYQDFSVLYIEDDDEVRDVIFSMLKRLFGDAYEAKDGIEGFKKYKEHRPDIVITDIKMPKLDGLNLSKKIRENDKKTKIIITTAFSDKEFLFNAIELNLERYLVKPLTRRNLLPAIEKAVNGIEKKVFMSKDFYYDFSSAQFYYKDKIIDLTKKELLFLTLLVKNRGKIVKYEQIDSEVWDSGEMSLKSLRSIVTQIRKKTPFNAIENISNIGYKLRVE